MKAQFAVLAAVVCAGAGLATWQLTPASTALAGDEILQAASATAVTVLAEDYEYVGSSKCKKCHIKSHRSWKKTKMGQALETLKPGKAAEVKKKFSLDLEKDYSRDTSCIGCHTTGYGHPGGYVVPDPSDKKAVRKAKKLQGVGCESCHGPGSAYIKVFEEIFKSKRQYKVDELYAVGLRAIDESTCTQCHNEKSATFDAAHPFNFEEKKDEDRHEKEPLKQREG